MSDVLEGAVPFVERPMDAMTGTEFVNSIIDLPLGEEREQRIMAELLCGNVPSWARQGLAVPVAVGDHVGVFFALPDYLAIGSDNDYVRVPMNPLTATAVADAVGCTLPTRSMVNGIWTASIAKLEYKNLPPTPEMTSTKWFADHNALVQEQLISMGIGPVHGLVGGHKKDVVICKALETHLDRVAIYGWCAKIHPDMSWTVIQNLNPTSHDNKYADYSHGIRLVCAQMLVDQQYMPISEVLASADLHGMLSDEGPLSVSRYPGT